MLVNRDVQKPRYHPIYFSPKCFEVSKVVVLNLSVDEDIEDKRWPKTPERTLSYPQPRPAPAVSSGKTIEL